MQIIARKFKWRDVDKLLTRKFKFTLIVSTSSFHPFSCPCRYVVLKLQMSGELNSPDRETYQENQWSLCCSGKTWHMQPVLRLQRWLAAKKPERESNVSITFIVIGTHTCAHTRILFSIIWQLKGIHTKAAGEQLYLWFILGKLSLQMTACWLINIVYKAKCAHLSSINQTCWAGKNKTSLFLPSATPHWCWKHFHLL